MAVLKSAVRRSPPSIGVRHQLAIEAAYPLTSATVAGRPSALLSRLLSIRRANRPTTLRTGAPVFRTS